MIIIKKILIIFVCFMFTSLIAFAEDEVSLEFNEDFQKHSINITTVEQLVDDSGNLEEAAEFVPEDVSGIESIDTPLPEIVVSENTTPMTLYAVIQKNIAQTIKNIKDIEVNDLENVMPLFEDNLTKHFEKGPFSSIQGRVVAQNNVDFMMPGRGELIF